MSHTNASRIPAHAAKLPIAPLSRRDFLRGAITLAAGALLPETSPAAPPAETKPTLYLVATAHNDTQWNWTVQETINSYIPNTIQKNDALFDQFPHYNFNYEGVMHYKFCKEYHPALWETLKKRVAEGRWKLAGSWINAVDTNIPSAESLFRQALYGQQFFRREFGTVSRDAYLPDCFGFPASLPTIIKHSGLIAFSTQKLTWGCWIPAPFAVGRWIGVDGSEVVASLRPGAYITKITSDPSVDPKWQNDFVDAKRRKVDLRYFGTGDRGGAPDTDSVKWLNQAVGNPNGTAKVLSVAADQLAKDLTPAQIAALPSYKGELLLRLHAVGCYTSQAAMKKWNRANEQLADAAERACVFADWLGGMAYPRAHLAENWIRVLWHQFHDDVTGTCIPQAYTFSWNDELIAGSGFASALTASIGALAQGLNTQVKGVPLAVYNPMAIARRDSVQAELTLPKSAVSARVFDTVTGDECPSQILAHDNDKFTILFLADMPSVALKVFDVRPSDAPCALPTGLTVSETGLENAHLTATLDANGNLSSLIDRATEQEMLSAPAHIAFLDDPSPDSPAWEILYNTVTTPPRATLNNPKIEVIEEGAARIAVQIKREFEGSIWTQTIRLDFGGETLQVFNEVDWKTPGTLVKASFPMTATNPKATFDLDLGVIERGNILPNLWEVPAHQWADITDKSGTHGLAILNDCKYGWDKPADDVLRLTLLHSPRAGQARRYQGVQDIGRHEFTYALAPHAGDWRKGNIPILAARLNQPLRAFHVPAHSGALGRVISLVKVNTEQVGIRALKLAEDSDEIVVRVQELHGQAAKDVEISFAAPLIAAREINAAEEPVAPLKVENGLLRLNLTPFSPRTVAVKLEKSAFLLPRPKSKIIPLPFNLCGTTRDADHKNGKFDEIGRSIPAELLPAKLTVEGIDFAFGSSAPEAKNVVVCTGQKIALPAAPNFHRLYLLACAVGGDTDTEFVLGTNNGKHMTAKVNVKNWTRHIGQWFSTLEGTGADGGKQVVKQTKEGTIEGLENLKPAFVKRDTIAWVGSHRHSPAGSDAHILCYLFRYALDVPVGISEIVLPNDANLRIFAMTLAQSDLDKTQPAQLLYAPELG